MNNLESSLSPDNVSTELAFWGGLTGGGADNYFSPLGLRVEPDI